MFQEILDILAMQTIQTTVATRNLLTQMIPTIPMIQQILSKILS